eukprot:sb/3468952/
MFSFRWVKLETICDILNITKERLQQIYKIDSLSKQRLKIKRGSIRAMYGHSGGCGDVWGDLKGVFSGYAVHGTDISNMDSIARDGLEPRGRDVHMCPVDKMNVLGRANSSLWVLIDIGEARKCRVKIRACPNGVLLAKKTIPSSVLTFFGKDLFEIGHAPIFTGHLFYRAGLTKAVVLSDSILKHQGKPDANPVEPSCFPKKRDTVGPNLPGPNLPEPRFTGQDPFPPSIPVNRGPTVFRCFS